MKDKCFLYFIVFIIASSSFFGAAAEKASLRIGYLPLMNQLPIVISYENDRSDLSAADIRIFEFAAPTSIEAAFNVGAIDAAYVSFLIACKISSKHKNILFEEHADSGIKIIGALHRGGNRLVSTVSGGPELLEDKIIGVPGFRCTENMELRVFMADLGFRYGLDYKTIATPFEAAVISLKAGTLNAVYLPEPYGSIAESQNIAEEVKETEASLGHNLSKILIVQSETLSSKGDAVEEWLASLVKACRYIEQDIADTGAGQSALIQKKYFGFPEEVVKNSLSSRKGGLVFQAYAPDIREMERITRKAMEMRLMIEPVDLDLIYNAEYMKQALNK